MFGSGLIVFREVLEAALVVSIVTAASKGARARGLWIGGGVVLGLVGACLVAAFAQAISHAASGVGQEIMNASVLLAAVLMLGWHNVWMSKHGRELAKHVSRVGREVVGGGRPLYVLMVVVGLAVLREGSETVLFLYGMGASGAQGMPLFIGGLIGLAGGVLVGLLLYRGLLTIPTRYFFSVTSWMILLLAAGMASQAGGFLNQAGLLPALDPILWDTSGILSARSVVGQLLHILVGYDPRPSGIQLVFYVATLLVIGVLTRTIGRTGRPPSRGAGRTDGAAVRAMR